MAGPSLMDSIFQRSLEDLIKGLRLHNHPGGSESSFISKSLEEIRREIKSTDPQTKATALQKLTYLHSLHGYDMSWAAFHAIELTSSTHFATKKIGYLAASLSLNSSTDVLLLLTNQLRKDLSSPNPYEVSLALECVSIICTPDLAQDLTPDIFNLLKSNKHFVKKKAISTILRVLEQYPDAVRICFKRLVENLECSDVQIVSAVLGVFCELASKEPKSYLPLAPEFYRILVDCKNNWVLIKVLKVFAKLAPLEPRLGKRVVEPICEHMGRSIAKSLVFECVRTVVSCLSEYESALRLAVAKIREFLVDDDPNLKYLGLQALTIIVPKHLWAVLENKDVVIKSLTDADPNIKFEALRLVMAMVSEDNVADICRVLINYALKSDPEFCNEILGSVLFTCSRNVYEIIIDFDWYVSLLGEMSRIPHCQKGNEIENQLIDIGMRVKDARAELVHVARDLLIDPALLGNPFMHHILSAAAWVSGEYAEFSKKPFELMEALLQPRTTFLPPSIRAVYLQSAFKVLTFCLSLYLFPNEAVSSSSSCPIDLRLGITDSVFKRECPESSDFVTSEPDEGINPRVLSEGVEDPSLQNDDGTSVHHVQASSAASVIKHHFKQETVVNMLNLIRTALGALTGSHELEIQERVRNIFGLIELIHQGKNIYSVQQETNIDRLELKAFEIIKLMCDAFSEELGPVLLTAQKRVQIPDGLTLKENLNDLETILGDVQLPMSSSFSLGRPQYEEKDEVSLLNHQNKEDPEQTTESTFLLAEHRKRHGLYYLPSVKKESMSSDYPPAYDPHMPDSINDDADYLVKLTEQSLVLKKKPKQSKPRPVVVMLDDADGIPITENKSESKDDLISGAIHDVLLGNEAVASSSQSNLSDKSSNKRRGKEKIKENYANAEISELGKSKSRKGKHHTHGKERKHRSPKKNTGQKEENVQKDKQKSSHHHGEQKSRQRSDGTVNVVAQTPVIPDFLL